MFFRKEGPRGQNCRAPQFNLLMISLADPPGLLTLRSSLAHSSFSFVRLLNFFCLLHCPFLSVTSSLHQHLSFSHSLPLHALLISFDHSCLLSLLVCSALALLLALDLLSLSLSLAPLSFIFLSLPLRCFYPCHLFFSTYCITRSAPWPAYSRLALAALLFAMLTSLPLT